MVQALLENKLRHIRPGDVDTIMTQQIERFQRNLKSNTVAVTLLRGGLRFERDFQVDAKRRLRADAKRLDFGKKMMFGFAEWEGLEGVQEDMNRQGLENVELAFVDDCGATFGSVQSAIVALQRRAAEGLFPKIDKVYVYVMVGAQPGIVDMYRNMSELGMEIELVVGDMAYQLSDRGYIQRAEGETHADGTPFTPGQQVVGDMGSMLS